MQKDAPDAVNRASRTAIGMLIVLHSVDQAGVCSLLREQAAPTGRRVAEVAARFVETRNLDPGQR
jgi:hypothetical protein